MISRGRSFSGHERNCVFLNLGNRAGGRRPTFADVSAGSGFDYPDDARALALVDWDDDGDLDLWVANRNGPRLRLMRNELPEGAGQQFLSLRLRGNGTACNRDAVGARVEVVTAQGTLRRSLRAGEGFVSQSSMGLHFGLGETSEVEKVIVRWPDRKGSIEEFGGVKVGGRFLLEQGKGVAVAVSSRRGLALKASEQELVPVSRTARIPMVQLLKGPELSVADGSGRTVQLGAGKPVLVNLWASWCAPCLVELAEIAERENELRAAGVEVVALSVDALDSSDKRKAAANAAAAIKKLKFPFVSAVASEQVVGRLQWHHDNAVGHRRRLPLPSSFLIDGSGFVSVIYKGPLSVDDLLRDLSHSAGTRGERWRRSAPLPGTQLVGDSIARTIARLDANLYFHHAVHQESLQAEELAIYYYGQAELNRPLSARVHRGLGNLHARRKDWQKALDHFIVLIGLVPDDPAARYSAAACHQQLRQLKEARVRLIEAIQLHPGYGPALNALATLDLTAGNHAGAVHYFEALLKVDAANVPGRNNLAWLLATSREESLRNGVRALELAQGLVEEDGGKSAAYLDTLAAAQAENGLFQKAVATARRGLQVARAAGDQRTAGEIARRLPVYERGEALRE